MIETTILQQLQQLPLSRQQDVLDYIESLLKQQAEVHPVVATAPQRQRAFGIWQGKVHMADDFDAPLDDLQDYM
jgi:Protein of unknown function (DUF2281)